MEDFEEQAAGIISAILKADDDGLVQFTTSQKFNNKIRITIPQNLGLSTDFQQTLLDLGVLPSDVFKSNKKIRKNRANLVAYIDFIDNNLQDSTVEELDKVLEGLEPEGKLVSEIAPFILKAFRIWNNLPGGLRSHRSITEAMVRGYLKQRETYSHDEIFAMLETYGKWAKAYDDAINNDENPNVFWFHRSTLEQLLISNKMFPNHLEEGWSELIKAKNIPPEYRGYKERIKDEPDPEATKLKRINIVAGHIAAGGSEKDYPELYAKYQDEIDALVEKKRSERE